jgi:hypothetical protein
MKAGAVITSIAAVALLTQIGQAPAQQGSGASIATTNVPGRSVTDLAMLCNAGLQDPNRSDALGYCTGFIVGVGQFHTSLTAAGGLLRPIFCVPNPQPTLRQAAAAFVTWTRANPQHAADRAVDGLMRFAAETYPCPTAPVTRPR